MSENIAVVDAPALLGRFFQPLADDISCFNADIAFQQDDGQLFQKIIIDALEFIAHLIELVAECLLCLFEAGKIYRFFLFLLTEESVFQFTQKTHDTASSTVGSAMSMASRSSTLSIWLTP